MKRFIITFIFLFLLTACGNSLYKNTEKVVLENNYNEIEKNINTLFERLSMFPTEEDENEVIMYLKVINDNKNNFTKDELINIQNIYLGNKYLYQLNSIGYNLDTINDLINNLDK